MNTKRILAMIIAVCVAAGLLAACGASSGNNATTKATEATAAPETTTAAPETTASPETTTAAETEAETEAADEVDFNGTYNLMLTGPMTTAADLVVTTENGTVTGTYNGNELTSGKLEGNAFELKCNAMSPVGEVEVTIVGTVDGTTVEGTITSTAEFTFTGNKAG